MALDEISGKIGDAWAMHRKGDHVNAARAFEDVLRTEAENVDAHYGLGLAKRAAGDKSAAKASFEKAKSLAERNLAELRTNNPSNDLKTNKDDRYMMLTRMLQQRLAEL
ncbi:MAG: tetratricopeptide repeat protein [Chloroflexi bacterium]|nr:tetratricopeptide repeat protein [Chloroflexota bacterium]